MDNPTPEQRESLLDVWNRVKPNAPDILAICKCGCGHKILKCDTRPDLAFLATNYDIGFIYDGKRTTHYRKCLKENFK